MDNLNDDKFINSWTLDKKCYRDTVEIKYTSRAEGIFMDTKNKMYAASENLIKDFFKYNNSIFMRERDGLTNKQETKKDYMLFIKCIVTALNTGMLDNTHYGEGLEALKMALDRYPEEKDEIICKVLPLLKSSLNRYSTAENKVEFASLSRGIVLLTESVSVARPDITNVVLPILNQKNIQYGLSLDISDKDIRKAQYSTNGSFIPEYFIKSWKIDKELYTDRSWSMNKMEYNQLPYSGHRSIDIFQDTKNKMQVSANNICCHGLGKFYEKTYECEINGYMSVKEVKDKYLSRFDDVVAALDTNMVSSCECYGIGMWYLATMLKKYPEEEKIQMETIRYIKKAYKKLEKTEDDKDKAFLAKGIIELADSISTVTPDLTEYTLSFIKSKKVQSGLKIDPYREDDEINSKSKESNYSYVCDILRNMLTRDDSLLMEIKDISKAYAECSKYVDLEKDIKRAEQINTITKQYRNRG